MQDLRCNSSTLKRYWPVTWWRHFVAKNSAMNKQALLNFCVSFIWSMHIIFTHKMSVCCTYLHNKCGVWVWNLLKPNSNTCIFDGYNHMEQVDCLMNIVRGRTWWSNSNVSDKLVKKSTFKEFKRKLYKMIINERTLKWTAKVNKMLNFLFSHFIWNLRS